MNYKGWEINSPSEVLDEDGNEIWECQGRKDGESLYGHGNSSSEAIRDIKSSIDGGKKGGSGKGFWTGVGLTIVGGALALTPAAPLGALIAGAGIAKTAASGK